MVIAGICEHAFNAPELGCCHRRWGGMQHLSLALLLMFERSSAFAFNEGGA
jgi:hypothetical protein